MNLSVTDSKMFAKFYGRTDLLESEDFWDAVLEVYRDQNVPMPYALNLESVRIVRDYLECPPGSCGHCCDRAWYTFVTDRDLERIGRESPAALELVTPRIEVVDSKKNIKGPCPFLVDRACSIYKFRPDTCYFFPCQPKMHVKVDLDGAQAEQLYIRAACKPAVQAIRAMFRQVLSKDQDRKMILLPNLNLVIREA